jgi:class 3 adenylate cyclase/uncharacterized membrane protein
MGYILLKTGGKKLLNIISILLVSIGSLIMLYSIITFYRSLVSLKIQANEQKIFANWIYTVCMLLMLFFLFGYITVILFYITTDTITTTNLIIEFILFFGAVFVCTMVLTLRRMSAAISKKTDEIIKQLDHINRFNESTIRFVPLQFMEHLGVSDITKMKLGYCVQREITILFFDIRYFSITSEMMTVKENFLFINKVLGIAGPVIREYNGFVDKYIGDGVLALFDNGNDAVRAGIKLYRKLIINLNTKVKTGIDGIDIGVGIHTGSVMMGIIGENERLSSTVISANVNLASRVESLSKQTGSGMLITKHTMSQLSNNEDEFANRFIGMVQVAGVNESIGLFDMLDALSDRDRRFRLATKKVFESGVRKFHQKDYVTAVKRFEKVVAADPNDICAVHHLSEAKKRLTEPNLPSIFIFDKK